VSLWIAEQIESSKVDFVVIYFWLRRIPFQHWLMWQGLFLPEKSALLTDG